MDEISSNLDGSDSSEQISGSTSGDNDSDNELDCLIPEIKNTIESISLAWITT